MGWVSFHHAYRNALNFERASYHISKTHSTKTDIVSPSGFCWGFCHAYPSNSPPPHGLWFELSQLPLFNFIVATYWHFFCLCFTEFCFLFWLSYQGFEDSEGFSLSLPVPPPTVWCGLPFTSHITILLIWHFYLGFDVFF